MNRVHTVTVLAALLAGGGCGSNDHGTARLPGDTASPTAGNGDGGVRNGGSPADRPQRINGTGDNGDQLPMNGLH